MENQEVSKIEFVNSQEELAESINRDVGSQNTEADVEVNEQQQGVNDYSQQEDNVETAQLDSDQYSVDLSSNVQYEEEEEYNIEDAVFGYLSEKLNREIYSMDDIVVQESIDPRVESISRFVQETGRDPQDWFTFQSLDTSEMDDTTAVRLSIAIDNPDLTSEEIDLLMGSKYKLNEDMYDEQEVRLSRLQLKLDANKAKEVVSGLRDSYSSPVQQEDSIQEESFIDEEWISEMSYELDSLTGLEFDLGSGKSFTFGLDDKYKNQLRAKNSQLENYFDDYVDNQGQWDFDKLSSHRALIDNIDTIASSIYRQGLSDGQRGIVDKASNMSQSSPNQQNINNTQNPVVDQLRNIIGGGNKMTFNI